MWEMVQDSTVKCWIDSSDVVKGKHNGKECNDWKNSIGCTIGVRYKWRNDEMEERLFEIVGYDKNTQKLTLKWNKNEYLIITGDLQRGKLGRIFDKKTLKFKYEIGQVVNGLAIIERYYKENKKGRQDKWYKYICEKGHVHEIIEDALKKGNGCPICANKTVLEGYNDLATTRPDLVPYFLNPDDAKKYTAQSNKKITLKCPLCGKEKTMPINNLTNQGFSCSNCDDGTSIPEKYMSNILHSINCNFKHQLTKVDFEWISKYKYDFYLIDYNVIIETHGEQHYRDSKWSKVKDVQLNDTDKLKLVQQNGYELNKNYFVIDCHNTNFKFLTEQIKRILNIIGELYNIDFSNVNYKECYIKSQTSIFQLVVDIANGSSELSLQQIADKLKETHGYQLNGGTIGKYLKKSNELHLTNYKNKNEKVVICITTEETYKSITEASKQTGVNLSGISACCRGKHKSAGKDENGEPLVWMFYEDYLKMIEEKGAQNSSFLIEKSKK